MQRRFYPACYNDDDSVFAGLFFYKLQEYSALFYHIFHYYYYY